MDRSLKILIPFDFHEGPWGGGNQFLKGLCKQFKLLGHQVETDPRFEGADVVMMNSFHFESLSHFERWKEQGIPVVHRIDGPTQLIRGVDRGEDRRLWDLNLKVDATIFQSRWSLEQNRKLGWEESNPTFIILNGTDPDLFPYTPRSKSPNDPFTLVGSSWSPNKNKGLTFFKMIDDLTGSMPDLDMIFVGTMQTEFKNIKHLPAVAPRDLAGIYSQADIFIAPSKNDPCSNALIEAQACGLPAMYYKDGGHEEIVSNGGTFFDEWSEHEFLESFEEIRYNYDYYHHQISPLLIEQAAKKYLGVFYDVV